MNIITKILRGLSIVSGLVTGRMAMTLTVTDNIQTGNGQIIKGN